MRKFRNLSNVEEGYIRNHPEEIDDYVAVLFEEYAKDSDIVSLLSSLRVVCRVTLPRFSGHNRVGCKASRSVQNEEYKTSLYA